jgi:hypothetical protein
MGTRTADKNRIKSSSNGTFVCSECGVAFPRAASLGAHRRQAHGVVGATSSRRRRASSRTSARPDGGVDRDALLRILFPSGLPARAHLLEALNHWLDEADALTQLD